MGNVAPFNTLRRRREPREDGPVETVEEATRKARARMARPESVRDLREAREWAAMIAEMQDQAAAGTLSEMGRRLLEAHLRLDG